MPIEEGRYVPPVHVGTKEEIAQALVDEAHSIATWGWMRSHAKGRELQRIETQLESLGVMLLEGTGTDEGRWLGVTKHEKGCKAPADRKAVCDCKPRYVSEE